MTSLNNFDDIKKRAIEEIRRCKDSIELEVLRIKYIGRKGISNSLFKNLDDLQQKEKSKWGKKLNEFKIQLNVLFKEKKSGKERVNNDFFDPTLPPPGLKFTKHHPITQVLKQIEQIFISMGFGVAYGPEIETNYYNFTALNMPENHPARDMHDTFYLKKKEALLRTHTSPVQIRIMENSRPPYKFIAPGKCYRRDTIDASHSPMFHQVEGLMVDKNISFADLKGILNEFAARFFNEKVKSRFRSSFFPFTEPSAEMDISCALCMGEGCPACSDKGWLEILGAGMVDPEVFNFCNVDTNKWQGFAFGMGVERLAMLKYGIDDIRLFFQNDLRFLEQF